MPLNALQSVMVPWAAVLIGLGSFSDAYGEAPLSRHTLYNGIKQPAQWPPKVEGLTREPMAVPYLESPPPLILIDVGRQLFVDDFLIEQTTLKRTFHRPQYHRANPLLKPQRPWERKDAKYAMPFSDGVWYDPKDQRFKMWYMGGLLHATCLAESTDGIEWERPDLDVQPGTNIVHNGNRDSCTIWLDHNATNPLHRFKMFRYQKTPKRGLVYQSSADGIHWSNEIRWGGSCDDRTTIFYNPFRKVWVYSLRVSFEGLGRCRAYWEHPDAEKGMNWQKQDMVPWLAADRLDHHHPQFKDTLPQLYNVDAVAYESLLLGLFSIHKGPPNEVCKERMIQKRNEVVLGFSRDGFHFYRPDRRAFLAVNESKGAWNWGNVQSVGGGCLVVGDKLYFYFSGRALNDEFWDGEGSTGLAILRRDGFASMDAGLQPGTLTTRLLQFEGKQLYVNADAAKGQVRVEILDQHSQVIAPFTKEASTVIETDTTIGRVHWDGASDLAAVAGSPVRFRFHLKQAHLYAFWVGEDRSGASSGYVAAGGPGFTTGTTDTVGLEAYRAANRQLESH